jgi:hypothetical protein
MQRKYYSARPSEPGGTSVYVMEQDAGEHEALDPRADLANHSPSGFAWGYGGSGPAQLALAIAADHLGDDEAALESYQLLKDRLIAEQDPDEPLHVLGSEVAEALAGAEPP